MRKLLDFYIDSHLHVGLAVGAFFLVSCITFNVHPPAHLLGLTVCSTLAGYSFIKYGPFFLRKKGIEMRRFQYETVLAILASLVSVYCFSRCSWPERWIVLASGFGTLIYALPVLPNQKNLRNWAGIKIYTVAVIWSLMTVLLPIVAETHDWDTMHGLYFLKRMIVVLVLLFIFEIVDLEFDDFRLKTIPQMIGVKKTKKIGFSLLVLVILIDSYLLKSISIQLVNTIWYLLIGLFLWRVQPHTSRYYATFYTEGFPIIWLVMLLLMRCFDFL